MKSIFILKDINETIQTYTKMLDTQEQKGLIYANL
jgi:hypothetical protein